ncbi:Predicted lipoprotein with conserved Yx(FWY)xxD motif, partial [Streptomyces sp. DvalAA-14]
RRAVHRAVHPAAAGDAAGAAGVHTASDATLGTIVVNGKGFTLYRFDMDTNKPPTSHCTGACATLWPAAPATDASAVKGIDQKLLGSTTGTDGRKQLTLNGWPLYTYAQDSKAGDTNGQGIDGIWWAVTPAGAKAGAASSAGSTAGSPSTTSSTTGSGSSGGSYGY